MCVYCRPNRQPYQLHKYIHYVRNRIQHNQAFPLAPQKLCRALSPSIAIEISRPSQMCDPSVFHLSRRPPQLQLSRRIESIKQIVFCLSASSLSLVHLSGWSMVKVECRLQLKQQQKNREISDGKLMTLVGRMTLLVRSNIFATEGWKFGKVENFSIFWRDSFKMTVMESFFSI